MITRRSLFAGFALALASIAGALGLGSGQSVPRHRADAMVAPVRVSERPTRIDCAHIVKDLVDVHYPNVERLVLVTDQRHTHSRPRWMKPFRQRRPSARPKRGLGGACARDG